MPAHAESDGDDPETECNAGDLGDRGECRDSGDNEEEQGPEEPAQPVEGDVWVEEQLLSPCSTAPPGDNPGDTCTQIYSCPSDDERQYAVWLRDHEYNGSDWEIDRDWYRDDPRTQCRERPDDELDDETVRQAVVEFGLPEAEPQLNPPDGNTLVNFDTVFYTTTPPAEFTLTLANTDVQIRATPERFHWDFDETTHTSTHPGQPWHNNADLGSGRFITHNYTNTGTHHINVDVNYTVDWHDGDNWNTIPDNITGQPTPPTEIDAHETVNQLRANTN